jgi:hypothetical protein
MQFKTRMNLVLFQWWNPKVRPDNSMDEYWDEMIYKEDLELAKNSKFKSNIFELEGQWNEYKIIKQLNITLRVKNNCLKPINSDGLYFGDKVEVIPNEQNSFRIGIIFSLEYHYKEKKILYYLTDLNNKELKKRYFSEDLIKI